MKKNIHNPNLHYLLHIHKICNNGSLDRSFRANQRRDEGETEMGLIEKERKTDEKGKKLQS